MKRFLPTYLPRTREKQAATPCPSFLTPMTNRAAFWRVTKGFTLKVGMAKATVLAVGDLLYFPEFSLHVRLVSDGKRPTQYLFGLRKGGRPFNDLLTQGFITQASNFHIRPRWPHLDEQMRYTVTNYAKGVW